MTVLHIITRLILGGAQQNTVASCAAQVEAGHRVTLVYGPIYGPEGSLQEQAIQSGAELVCVGSLRRAVLPVHDAICYRALRKLIRRIKPDVVHTHSSKAGILGRAAAWKERVPAIVHTVHGLPFHEGNTAFVNGLYVALERAAAKQCHAIVGVTQAMVDTFLHRRIGRQEQYRVIPSGVDPRNFSPATVEQRNTSRAELHIPESAQVIGLVARLDPFKGQDDLIEIAPRLLESLPELRILLVGEGWHGPALRQRVTELGLSQRVIFSGLVPPDRVARLIHALDVSVLPSRQEGQPRSLVQSLFCAVPVVAYDSGGIGEVCVDGKTGRLVHAGDRHALTDALRWMLSHPHERKQLGEQGRAYALERFDLGIMTRRLETLYAQLLATKD